MSIITIREVHPREQGRVSQLMTKSDWWAAGLASFAVVVATVMLMYIFLIFTR